MGDLVPVVAIVRGGSVVSPRVLLVAVVVALSCYCSIALSAGISLRVPTAENPLSIELAQNTLVTVQVDFNGEFGITGASFRISGMPQGWVGSMIPNPAASLVTGAVTDQGTEIGFDTCQGVPLTLLELQVFATTFQQNVLLLVEEHSEPPSECPLNGPSVLLCDSPVFTRVCVGGLPLCINSESCPLVLPVEEETWTRIKSLYR
jgi:hypothetical protein